MMSSAEWWSAIKPTTLRPVRPYPALETDTALRISKTGFSWSNDGSRIDWSDLAKIDLGTHTLLENEVRNTWKPSTRWMLFGVLGSIYNKRRTGFEEMQCVYIRLTTTGGTSYGFVTTRTRDDVMHVLGPAMRSLKENRAG